MGMDKLKTAMLLFEFVGKTYGQTVILILKASTQSNDQNGTHNNNKCTYYNIAIERFQFPSE